MNLMIGSGWGGFLTWFEALGLIFRVILMFFFVSRSSIIVFCAPSC